jgi:hypothetical protein
MVSVARGVGKWRSEAGALWSALAQAGVTVAGTGKPPSEALLFGIGGGIGLGYFVYESGDYTSLFIATRITTNETPQAGFLHTICERAGVNTEIQTATSAVAAEKKLRVALVEGQPVLVWVDARKLPYPYPAATYHALMVTGYEETQGQYQVADRFEGQITLSPQELTGARQGEGAPKFRGLAVTPGGEIKEDQLRIAMRQGILDCVEQMREGFGPPNFRSNFGLQALEKWAGLLLDTKDKRGWARFFPAGLRLFNALLAAYQQIEQRGEGGALRPLYADFLEEAAWWLKRPNLVEAAEKFRASAERWRELSAALLPDEVPSLKEARDLTDHQQALFFAHGRAAQEQMQSLSARLEEMRSQIRQAFPLGKSGIEDLLEEIRRRVMAVLQTEQEAVSAISEGDG